MNIYYRLGRTSLFALFILPALFAAAFSTAFGQEKTTAPERGFHPGSSYAVSDLETINLQSGNVIVNLPLASLPAGRGGMSAALSLRYNSKLYDMSSGEDAGGGMRESLVPNTNDGGWSYAYRYRIRRVSNGDQDEDYLVMPDGGQHKLCRRDANGATVCFVDDSLFSATNDYYTIDGTYLRLYRQSGVLDDEAQWILMMPDGTIIFNKPDPNNTALKQRVADRNGNYIDIYEYSTDSAYNNHATIYIKDQLNRKIVVEKNADPTNYPNQDWIRFEGFGGADLVTRVQWKTISVKQKIAACLSVCESQTINQNIDMTFPMVERVFSPAPATDLSLYGGLFYEFDYNDQIVSGSNPARSYGWGEIEQITLPSGAAATYKYEFDNQSSSQTARKTLSNRVTEKQLTYTEQYDGNSQSKTDMWTYGGANCTITGCTEASVTAPDGATTNEYYGEMLGAGTGTEKAVYKTVAANGATVERVYRINKPTTTLPIEEMTPNNYVKYELTSITDNAGNLTKTAIKEYAQDKNGNQTEVKEYDFVPYSSVPRDGSGRPTGLPSNASSYLKRITQTDYYNAVPDAASTTYTDADSYHLSSNPRLLRLVKSSEIQNAGGTAQTRSEIAYDYTSYATNTKGGNPTETKSWDSFKDGSTRAYSNPLTPTNSISSSVSYDAYGNPTLTTDAKGYQTQITYGSVGGYSGLYPTQTVTAYGTPVARTSTAAYDFSTGLVTTATDADNVVSTETTYDALGRPNKVAAAVGTPLEIWTQTVYDDANRRVISKADVATKGDARKVAVQFYDQLGRVRLSKSLEDAAIQSATNEMDGIKVQTRYKTVSGYTYQLTSNPYRAATSAAAANEATMGWTLSTANANGKHSQIETFAGAGLPAAFSGGNTSSTGKVQTDTDADRTLVTDQAGKQRMSRTNALGQLIDVWEITAAEAGQTEAISFGSPALSLNGFKTSYAYDALSNLVAVNQGSQTRSFAYSSLSRLKSATNPELGTTAGGTHTPGTISYLYDDNGNLTGKTDARNVVTAYAYDALNRVTSRSYTNEPTGQLTTPNVSYTYDNLTNAKGKLTKVTTTGTGANTFSAVTDYQQFDQMGRVTQSQQTVDGVTYGTSLQLYKYNLSGALVEQTYPSGRVVKNVLDAEGDLALVQSKKNSNYGFWNYAKSFSYTAAGAVSSMQFGNGKWESTVFNSRLQPTQIALGSVQNGTDKSKLNYTYHTTTNNVTNADNNGNVLSQTITVPTETRSSTTYAGFTATQNYSYDALNRLKSAEETIPGQTGWKQTFKYDRYGNRNFDYGANPSNPDTTTPNAQSTTPKVVNPEVLATNNRFKQDQDNDSIPDYLYDASGNTTQDANNKKFTYDAENKQTKVETVNSSGTVTGTLGTYFYDGDGKRVKKVSATETVIFIYDAGGKLVAEYANQTVSNPQVSYLTADHLGSPRINTDQNGQVTSRHDYQPFGEEIYSISGNTARTGYNIDEVRKQFTSYERDIESGLDFAQARYFSSGFGRFSSPDDFLNDTSVHTPQSWNLYVYVRNNPLKYTDPNGEEVYGDRLTEEQRNALIADWQAKTGYKKIYFDKDKGYKLTIDTKAGFDSKLNGKNTSSTARTELLAAATSDIRKINIEAISSTDVGFARHLGKAEGTFKTSDGRLGETRTVQVDFKDFDNLQGDADVKESFSLGLAVLHEFEHALHNNDATGKDTPNGRDDPGPLETTYINPIRRELGLPERVAYGGFAITGTSLPKPHNNSDRGLSFKASDGTKKILSWQKTVVGGKGL